VYKLSKWCSTTFWILSTLGISNFTPRQTVDINKIEIIAKSLETICTQNGITGYIKFTYVQLKVMSTLIVQWNRGHMKNDVWISASAAWISRPVAVDINYTLCSATHSTLHHSVMLITTQTAYIFLHETWCTALAYFLRDCSLKWMV